MIQKAIDEGRLKFKKKPMKMDTYPFHVQANYIKPIQIMMMGASIGMPKVSTPFYRGGQSGSGRIQKRKRNQFSHLQGNHWSNFCLIFVRSLQILRMFLWVAGYVAFAYESDQAMAIIAPFKIEDVFYVNNKSGDEKDNSFVGI